MEEVLNKITEFAAEAHGKQQRKYVQENYIEHPVRVMKTCKEYSSSLAVLAAALLHDVLEDTAVTKNEMKEFLLSLMKQQQAEKTLQHVVDLTDVFVKSTYPHLNRRSRKSKELQRLEKISAEAQTIKYADIIDNVQSIGADNDFAPVYLSECKSILKKLDKGNSTLHHIAMNKVEEELRKLKK